MLTFAIVEVIERFADFRKGAISLNDHLSLSS
jgi:hypothetical protein